MTLTLTILGCGSSGGVPRPALGWGSCDPHNPKNRRRRCSLLVEQHSAAGKDAGKTDAGKTSILIDTSPDLREQLLSADVTWLDAVLYTHEHADHTHGIDDLRPLFIHRRKRLDLYMDEITSQSLNGRFGYCFAPPKGSDYPPIVNEHRIHAGQPVTIDGEGGPIEALPVLLQHGKVPSLAFRFNDVAYSPDLNGMPDESVAALAGLDLWIVDALRLPPHPSHFNLDDALRWIERLEPKRAILTNLHSDMDYDTLRKTLPPHIEPAFDGMRVQVA